MSWTLVYEMDEMKVTRQICKTLCHYIHGCLRGRNFKVPSYKTLTVVQRYRDYVFLVCHQGENERKRFIDKLGKFHTTV